MFYFSSLFSYTDVSLQLKALREQPAHGTDPSIFRGAQETSGTVSQSDSISSILINIRHDPTPPIWTVRIRSRPAERAEFFLSSQGVDNIQTGDISNNIFTRDIHRCERNKVIYYIAILYFFFKKNLWVSNLPHNFAYYWGDHFGREFDEQSLLLLAGRFLQNNNLQGQLPDTLKSRRDINIRSVLVH